MMADMAAAGHRVNQLVRGVFGVRGHEAEAVVAVHGIQPAQKLGKTDGIPEGLAVRIHILPEKGDIFIAVFHKAAEFPQDGVRPAAALSAPDVRHNAVGTEIVAAIHHREPRPEPAAAPGGKPFGDDRILLLVAALKHTAVPFEGGAEKLREPVQHMRAENQPHKRKLAADMLRSALFLHHTSADGDEDRRVAALELLKGPNVAEHPVFSVAAHSTGVEQDKIGLLWIFRKGKAHL